VVATRSHYFAFAAHAEALAAGPSLGSREGWRPAPGAPGRIDLGLLREWHGQRSV
jgi:hypothetical protein